MYHCVIKSVDLLLEESTLNLSPRLIYHINVHELSLASVIVPRSFITLFENSNLDPPVSFNVRVQPFNRNVSSFVVDQFMIFDMGHILQDLIVRYLHSALNVKCLTFKELASVYTILECELLWVSNSEINFSVNEVDWLKENNDWLLTLRAFFCNKLCGAFADSDDVILLDMD